MSVMPRSPEKGLRRLNRRTLLSAFTGSVAGVAFARSALAQDITESVSETDVDPIALDAPTPEPAPPLPFSFEWLDARMRDAAQTKYLAPVDAPEVIADLDYDDYRKIQFDPKSARWDED